MPAEGFGFPCGWLTGSPDFNGVTTFHITEIRADGMPSLLRGPVSTCMGLTTHAPIDPLLPSWLTILPATGPSASLLKGSLAFIRLLFLLPGLSGWFGRSLGFSSRFI